MNGEDIMADVLLVYWSGTDNTKIMAEKIKEGIESTGQTVLFKSVDEVDESIVEDFDKIAFGCPSMGIEELEEEEFEPFFSSIEYMLEGKKVALFGSYGWGEGEWMESWVERTLDKGALVFKEQGLIINSTPSTKEEEDCNRFGREFAEY